MGTDLFQKVKIGKPKFDWADVRNFDYTDYGKNNGFRFKGTGQN